MKLSTRVRIRNRIRNRIRFFFFKRNIKYKRNL